MPEENKPNLLPAAADALRRLGDELDKTTFTFSGRPQIEFKKRDGLDVLRCTVAFELPLQPASGNTPMNSESGPSSLSSSSSNLANTASSVRSDDSAPASTK